MSVIVAKKENGVIYMGADSQTTVGNEKYEADFKVRRMDNGILVGFCGSVFAKQGLLAEENVFTLDENGELTKKHIVQAIIPKLVDKMESIGDKEHGAMDVSCLLAHKDKLYKIMSRLNVLKLNDYGTIGAGMCYVQYNLSMQGVPVREQLLTALVESAKHTDSVSGPYVFIDTQNQEYEIVDMGGKNH